MASVALSSAAGAEPFAGWKERLTRTRRGTAVIVVVVGCVDWACSAVIPNSPRNTSTGAWVRVRIRSSFVPSGALGYDLIPPGDASERDRGGKLAIRSG